MDSFRAGLLPWKIPLPMTLSEHAEKYFYLAPESSSIEGPWVALPYQIGPMNWIGNDDIRIVTWRKSSRVGYTKIICAAMCYFAEHKRRNQTIYQPTDGDARKFAEDEIDSLLIHIPAMRAICKVDPEKKSSANTIERKKFVGSTLDILGGKSGRNYRRYTKDVVYYDELSGFDHDIDGEGSPTILGDTRIQTSSFPKSIRGSTPKIKGSCLISAAIEEADFIMLRFLPCPGCGGFQVLEWQNFDFETNSYICKHCGTLFGYDQYPDMDKKGQWRTADEQIVYDEELDHFFDSAGNQVPDPDHIGIDRLWSAYSYFSSWTDLIAEWKRAIREKEKTGSKMKLKSFINTRLGEEWEERGERVDELIFENNLEPVSDTIDNGVLFVTLGADVQGGKDARLEYEIVGHGIGEESWSLDYGRIPGDPDSQEPWDHLDEIRARIFTRADGIKMRIACVCVDAGFKTDAVYRYTRPRLRFRVFATKGYSASGRPIIGKYSMQGDTRLYMIGADTAKEVLYSRLNTIKTPGPGYCHFPADRGREYFDMLVSEEKRKKINRRTGEVSYEWVKLQPRNEALDCRVLNMAALKILNPNFEAIKRKLTRTAKKAPAKKLSIIQERKKRMAARPQRGFVNGWR